MVSSRGDPLGPLLFSLVLQPALTAAVEGATLDLCFAFLDDIVLAGNSVQVAAALRALCAAAAAAGLELEPTKSEVILPNPAASPDLRALPVEFLRRAGQFELLGAPIGGLAFCNQHSMSQRVDKAEACMDAIAQLPDPQTALLLLRHCSSYCRMSYATRVTPPASHYAALQEFDSRVRSALESIGSLQLSDVAWRQACLGTAQGGLGLRGTARHAPAAYLASITSTAEACTALLPQYLSAPLAQFNTFGSPSSAFPEVRTLSNSTFCPPPFTQISSVVSRTQRWGAQ